MKPKAILPAMFLCILFGLGAAASAATFSPADLLNGAKTIQQFAAVPEPSTYLLLGLGLAALLVVDRKRKNKTAARP